MKSMIKEANVVLNELIRKFGSDPLNITEYIAERLKANDFKVILNLSRKDLVPSLYGKLQLC